MKIGIIGSGNIGGNLGIHLAKAEHKVLFSSRHPEQLKDLAEEAGPNASVGNAIEAAGFGKVIILSVPFWAVADIADKVDLPEGKIIIETTNPYPQRDGKRAQEARQSKRAASEFVAEYFPKAYLLKAFNTIYYKHLRDQTFRDGEYRAIPYAGDHQPSLDLLEELIQDIGFDPVYVGKLSESHIMDVDQPLYTKDLTAEEVKKILENS